MSDTRLDAIGTERIPPGGEELAAYQRAIETAKDTIAELRRVIALQQEELDRWQSTGADAARAVLFVEQRNAELEQALRGAGHAVDCALQNGGACSCRMQLVRRHTPAPEGELFPPALASAADRHAIRAIGLVKKMRETTED